MDLLAETLDLGGRPIRLDSMAKYLLLASGQGDLLFRLISPHSRGYREKIWDQAAGSLLVEEAGGRISDLDGVPLDFTTGRLLENNRGVLASNGRLHQAALEALKVVQA
jgi:3'(2'), 5'-bisphosphate nucleotidase